MSGSAFYDAGPLEQVAINLFHGWGYNFYREENQLRADDLLIRGKVGALLGSARKSVETAQSDYRREFLPPPSRAKPQHDAAAIAGARTMERLSHSIGALQGLIAAQPAPENDRMTQRSRDHVEKSRQQESNLLWPGQSIQPYNQEARTLRDLIAFDQKLAGQAELLRSMLDQKSGAWIIENVSALEEGVKAIEETLRARQLHLYPTV